MSYLDVSPNAEIPEHRLWLAVIARTVEEWTSGPLRSRREAESFLFEDKVDFPVVCQAAGLNPERLRSELSRLRKGPSPVAPCRARMSVSL